MKFYRIAICTLLITSLLTTANATLHGGELSSGESTWGRVADQEIRSGMRVMIVNPDDVVPGDKAACRARVGSIAKVYSVGNYGEGEELVVLDSFGLGKVKAADIILLRQSDVFEQINDLIPKSHRGIALAEFTALYDPAAAHSRFKAELKRDPTNEELKTRYGQFLWKHNRLDELASMELNEHTQDDSVRLVITSALLPIGQRIDRLKSIAKRDKNDLFARISLAAILREQLLAPDEKSKTVFDWLDSCSDEINELVSRHPSAFTHVIVCSVDRAVKGGDVDIAKYKSRLGEAEKAMRRFPFDHDLLISLATGNLAAANYLEGGQFAMSAVTKFPTSYESVEMLRTYLNALDDAGVTNQEVKRFSEEYKIAYLISALKGTNSADFYAGELPHVSLIDGTAPISFEKNKSLSKRRGVAKLCSDDQVECLKFLKAFVPESISSASEDELFEAAVESGSYHVVAYLLSLGRKPKDVNRLFQLAIENGNDVVLLQLKKHSGHDFLKAHVDAYTEAFDVSSSDMQNELTKRSINRFKLELDRVFQQAIALEELAAENRRDINDTYAQLERIAAQQQVYGDSYGFQQTNAGIQQLKQQLRDTRSVSRLASSLAAENLSAEYEVVKEILDPIGLDEWSVVTEKHVEQNVDWFKTEFGKWKAKQ